MDAVANLPALSLSSKRASSRGFDSLQDLLEEAGYKETRIFTPISVKSSMKRVQEDQITPPLSLTVDEQVDKQVASTWYSSLWRSRKAEPSPIGQASKKALLRKQSEPALSKKSRKAVQRTWKEFWDARRHSEEDGIEQQDDTPSDTPATAASTSTVISPITAVSRSDVPIENAVPETAKRPSLRHAPTTSHLWQASMRHHRSRLSASRSFPARIHDPRQGRSLNKKESFDGVGVVATVGVAPARTVSGENIFPARIKQRISLREAFSQCSDETANNSESSRKYTHTSRAEWKDSVSSLVDLAEQREATLVNESDSDFRSTVHSQDTQISISNTQFFSSAATPILSRHDAVALRNVGCLDFASTCGESGLSSDKNFNRGLRKMRSVDALELALARIDRQRVSAGRAGSNMIFNTIPESFSTDSLTNEDLASAKTITTVMDNANSLIDFDKAAGEQTQKTKFIHRSTMPRLVITSPTGMRSPQPLVLDGREFEPRSISPEQPRMVRPQASRQLGWKTGSFAQMVTSGSVEGREVSDKSGRASIPICSTKPTKRRRSRVAKVQEKSSCGEDNELSVPPRNGKTAKKRLSKSCNDLRGKARESLVPIAGKLSGSEQIRALRRDVMQRTAVDPGPLAGKEYPTPIPCSANQSDDGEDPFSDFVDLAKGVSSAGASDGGIDRSRMSPNLFQQRQPLAASKQGNMERTSSRNGNSSSSSSNQQGILQRKKSGVGIACLVESEQPARSASTEARINNENAAPNPLLDSPTAHVLQKKSSRAALGRR